MTKLLVVQPSIICYSPDEVLEAVRVALSVEMKTEFSLSNPGFDGVRGCLNKYLSMEEKRYAIARLGKYFSELRIPDRYDYESALSAWITDFSDLPLVFSGSKLPRVGSSQAEVRAGSEVSHVLSRTLRVPSSRMWIPMRFTFPDYRWKHSVDKMYLVAERMKKQTYPRFLGYEITVPIKRDDSCDIDIQRVIDILASSCDIKLKTSAEEVVQSISRTEDEVTIFNTIDRHQTNCVLHDFGSFQFRIKFGQGVVIPEGKCLKVYTDKNADRKQGYRFVIGVSQPYYPKRFATPCINEASLATAQKVAEKLRPFKAAFEKGTRVWW